MNVQSYEISNLNVGPAQTFISLRGQFGYPDLAGQVLGIDLHNMQGPGYVQAIDLASGNTTITKLLSAGAVLIVPPTGNINTVITFKGVDGDTGVRLHATAPSLLTLDVSTTSFVLNVSIATTGFQLLWF